LEKFSSIQLLSLQNTDHQSILQLFLQLRDFNLSHLLPPTQLLRMSTSASTPIPIITVGQHAQIATYMVNALKPEYEGFHFSFLSLAALLSKMNQNQ
jgi:hypothetical protein